MCGIFGITSLNNVIPNVLEGISNLEYRGYDSAGIGFVDNDKIETIKQVGEIKNLINIVKNKNPFSKTCIAHTRWATHGKPTKNNAHPFVSENKHFCLVHNGIIENYVELKKELNCNFISETDSEVVLRLIEIHYKNNMLQTLNYVCSLLKGSYAFAVLDFNNPNCIYVTKNSSPCVVGYKKGESRVCSDINGIGDVDWAMVLNNQNIAVLTPEKIVVYNNDLKQVDLKKIKVEKLNLSSKGKFNHFMIKEIFESPKSITNTIFKYSTFELIKKSLPKNLIKKTTNILIVGCGTAYHASLMGKKILEENVNVNIKCEIASEFIYSSAAPIKGTLAIFVSQSGETADTIKALKIAKAYGLKTVAITNVKNSSITFVADYCLYTCAGSEVAVASTKAYVSQLEMFYLLAEYYKVLKNDIESDLISECAKKIALISEKININELYNIAQNVANDIFESKDLYMIGRNYDYVSALESSLKLKEISYIHSEAYPSGELKHGTLSLIDDNTFVFAFLTNKELLEKSTNNVLEVISRGAKAIVITQYDIKIKNAYKIINLNKIDDYYMPLTTIVLMQLLAYYVSVKKGINPDKPRSLAKSVTVE